ncbi:putative metal-dependent hydrolases with the TIM-barrel fold [Geoglobus ahangari]|uniref:Putative metal-dependent hydrolases with the TIM-barrel fold n=2 Tax=Geoglobus ahangari TaxID=113653 RepID=A0A0F7DCD0_9EURY|nr:putative metal-dependent hydrolases with the TIM-barrel fold [Geoglobus ahangari]
MFMTAIDTHIHSEGRSVEDLKFMAENGIKIAITCAFYPIRPSFPETLIDLARKLTEFEPERGEKAGMEIYSAVGIHPRCIPPRWDKVLGFIESYSGYVAIGEIGLEDGSDEEKEVLKAQLQLAKKLDVPAIIHTPRKNKDAILKKTLEILDAVSFPEELALIDHNSVETVKVVLEKRYWAGITVQPGKLTVDEAVKIIEEFGDERLIANSDTGFSESDMLAVKKLYDACGNERVVRRNAEKFFKI